MQYSTWNSGVLLAYARMLSIEDKEKYCGKMQKIIFYEDQFFSKDYGNWPDLRNARNDMQMT